MSVQLRFARRPNHDDKTFDSICRVCYRTVASHMREKADLEQAERKHVCGPGWSTSKVSANERPSRSE